jgi:hypothetical protein
MADALKNTAAFTLHTDALKVALYGTTPTPDKDVTSANSAYAVAQWVTGNEISQAVQWPVGGVALAGQTLDSGTPATVFLDGTDTASGSAATLSAVYGCLVYDSTVSTPVANQGIAYVYFGGSNSVVSGTFTVVA